MAANRTEYPIIYFAVIKLGAIVVPVNARFTAAEVAAVVGHAEAETFCRRGRVRRPRRGAARRRAGCRGCGRSSPSTRPRSYRDAAGLGALADAESGRRRRDGPRRARSARHAVHQRHHRFAEGDAGLASQLLAAGDDVASAARLQRGRHRAQHVPDVPHGRLGPAARLLAQRRHRGDPAQGRAARSSSRRSSANG